MTKMQRICIRHIKETMIHDKSELLSKLALLPDHLRSDLLNNGAIPLTSMEITNECEMEERLSSLMNE